MTNAPTVEQLQQRVNALEKELERQKRTAEEVVRLQKYHASVLYHVPDAIVTLDSTQHIIEWNPAAQGIFGYSAEEAFGRDLDDLISWPGASMEEARAYTQTLMSEHPLPPRETVRYARDGSRVKVIVSGAPIYLEGALQGIVAVYTDITRHEELENALKASEQTYRAIFENTGTASIIIDKDTTILLANKEFEELVGYPKAELEGLKSWKEFVAYEEDLQKMEVYHGLRREKPGSVPNIYEFKSIDKNGRIKDIVITVGIIPGSSQSVASLLDVTEYKKLQESLQQERDSLNNVLEHSADAIVIVDAKGRFSRWNRRAIELFGEYEQEELLSRKAFDFYSDSSELAQMLEQLRRDGFLRNHEISYSRKDGTSVQCSVSMSLLKDNKNRLVGNVSIIRDLTEWKKAEKRLNYMSFHDSLTDLYNRNYFEEEMNRLQDGRYAPLGIIICDVDGLKHINDTLGHEQGDQLLTNTASILRKAFRASDIIARIGGDEFSILIPQTSAKDMENLVQRLRTYVENHNKRHPNISISLSIGYALCEDQPANMQELFRRADHMMYIEKKQRGKSSPNDILQVLMKALEARDFITEGHSKRLQKLALLLARTKNLSENSISDLLFLARVHELGKLCIPETILLKPGSLTEEETREMQKHCENGHCIALAVTELSPIADWILKYQEWWNGQGYPLGLKGEEIPLPCRILAIVDAYDAMVSQRPYRNAMSHEEAVAELRRNPGTQFDPQLTETFINLLSG